MKNYINGVFMGYRFKVNGQGEVIQEIEKVTPVE